MSGSIGDQQLVALGGTGSIQDRLKAFANAAGTLDDLGYSLGILDLATTSFNETLLHNQAVWDNLSSVTLSADVSCYGDSLTVSATGGATPWPTQLAAKITNTVNNAGVSGERTDQIEARLIANIGTDGADLTVLQGGTNNSAQDINGLAYSNIITDFADMVAALAGVPNTNFIVTSGTFSGSATIGDENGLDRYIVNQTLKSTYGDKFFHFTFPLQTGKADEDWTAGETTEIQLGQVPLCYQDDATHPNEDGFNVFGPEIGLAIMAAGGEGIYPHSDIVYFDTQAAASTSIHTIRKLGSPTSWRVVASDDTNNLLDLNTSTGEFTRSSTGTPDNTPFKVRVRADNSADCTTLFVPGGDGNFTGVNIKRYGALAVASPPSFTDFTYVFFGRLPVGETGNCVFFTGKQATTAYSNMLHFGSGAFSPILKDSSGITIATNGFTSKPSGFNVERDFFFAISYDSTAGTCHSVLGSLNGSGAPIWSNHADGTYSGTKTGAVYFANYIQLFTNNTTYGNANPRILKRVAIYDHAWDWSTTTDRNKFVTSGTGVFEPTALSGGVVDGITPFMGIDAHGIGDLHPSQWYGSFTANTGVWNESLQFLTNNYEMAE